MGRRWVSVGSLALVATGLSLVAQAWAQADGDKLQRLNASEVALSVRQGDNLNRLSRLLTVLMRFRTDPPPALLISPDDATRAVRAAILIKAITPDLQARARVYALEAKEIARQRRLAAAANEATFSSESNMAEEVQASPMLEPPPAVLIPPSALAAPTSGPFVHRFGDTLASGGRSNGVTIKAASKAPVTAPQAGLVQYVGPVKGWGVILILRMTGGYHLVLAGLDKTSVVAGQTVAAGAAVGTMPDPAQGLYLEVRAGGDPVDPGRWLKAGT